jgi:predicted DNA-binding ribbon-helix-helix protein
VSVRRAKHRAAIVKHSIVIAGHRTSVSLEAAFWLGLHRLAAERGSSVAALVAEIDAGRADRNLSSAIRVFVLEETLARAAMQDHRGVGSAPGKTSGP